MKNVHLIPTAKPSRVWTDLNGNFYLHPIPTTLFFMQNIYITSDEEIKEGDWVVTNGGLRFVTSINNDKSKTFTDDGSISKIPPSPYCYLKHYQKIILTTDKDLTKDGVQSIDDEFLEWFVKNPSWEEVEVEKTFVTNSGLGYQEYAVLDSNFKVIEINAKIPQTSYYLGKVTILNTYEYVITYKIIIPKEELSPFDLKESPITDNEFYQSLEEPKQDEHYLDSYGCTKNEFELSLNFKKEEPKQEMPIINGSYGCIIETNKQETLEESAERYAESKSSNFSFRNTHIRDFKEGAKWQAKRMYSEEEVYNLLYNLACEVVQDYDHTPKKLDKWFEQFKKK